MQKAIMKKALHSAEEEAKVEEELIEALKLTNDQNLIFETKKKTGSHGTNKVIKNYEVKTNR